MLELHPKPALIALPDAAPILRHTHSNTFSFKVSIKHFRNGMKSKADHEQSKAVEFVNSNPNEFNFDLWAKQVRPQLLASLHKRGARY